MSNILDNKHIAINIFFIILSKLKHFTEMIIINFIRLVVLYIDLISCLPVRLIESGMIMYASVYHFIRR